MNTERNISKATELMQALAQVTVLLTGVDLSKILGRNQNIGGRRWWKV